MKKLEFAETSVAIHALLERAIGVLEENPATREHARRIEAIRADANRDCLLRVVLTGHFSAGKSSLVKALTGAEVQIGAGVTTTTTAEYRWCNVHLVDTPGIHADRVETGHDRIAREAVIGADLILFVVSNEQFSDRLAKHFHSLADSAPEGLGLASKIIVVVNKIDRESGDHDADIVHGVVMAIAPHDHVPILLCAAGQALQAAAATNPEKAEKHYRWSRFETFVPSLDRFVKSRGTTGRIVTPAQRLEDAVDGVISSLAALDGANEAAVSERRAERRALVGATVEFDKRVSAVRARVHACYDKAAQEVFRGVAKNDDAEDVTNVVENALEEASRQVSTWIEELDIELRQVVARVADELGDETFRQAAARRDRATFDAPGSAPDAVGASTRKVVSAGNKALRALLKNVSKDTKALRDTILSVGRSLGHKFRPHEASKLAKTVAGGAKTLEKALPLIGAALDLYLAYRDEKAEQERRRYLQGLQASIVRAFREAADAEIEAISQGARAFRAESLDAAVDSVEAALQHAAASGDANGATVAALLEIITESRRLRQRVAPA